MERFGVSTKVINRLVRSLTPGGGMKVGEIMKLTAKNVNDQELILQAPKSGNEATGCFKSALGGDKAHKR